MPFFKPSRCQICTTPLRRSTFVWTTNGRTVYICPKCNTRLETMKSREAFNPSKPFVFPPIIEKKSFQSSCGTLIGGTVLVVVVISAISALINAPTPSAPATPTLATVAPVVATPILMFDQTPTPA